MVRIYNTGRVVLTQRYLAAYSVTLNMRDYPFDSQSLNWDVRSTIYNNSVVKFLPAASPSVAAASILLHSVSDTDWTFDKYSQAAYTIDSGIFTNYDLLSISIVATRISQMSSSFVILPICLICAALCLELFMDPAEPFRIQTPLACITATMGFSFVVADLCPPVSYNTRMHLMIFQTYIFSVIALVCNSFLWYIEVCKQRLSASNSEMKTLLADSHEVATRLKSHNVQRNDAETTTKVIAKEDPLPLPGHGISTQELREIQVSPLPQTNDSESAGPVVVKYFHGAAFGSAADTSTILSSRGGREKKGVPPTGKSQETGAFRNDYGEFHDVRDLLAAPEVETFKKLEWGGGPIIMFFGTQNMTTENLEGWSR